MAISNHALGRQLRVYRIARGLNQDQVAQSVGRSRAWLSNVERGLGISLSLLPSLLAALGFDKPEEMATRLLANETEADDQLVRAEVSGSGIPSARSAADALRTLLSDHEAYRHVLAFHPAVLSATKAVVFDLEELAESESVGSDSRTAGVLELANRLRNALALAKTAARLGQSAATFAIADAASAIAPVEPPKEEVENGDHQTE